MTTTEIRSVWTAECRRVTVGIAALLSLVAFEAFAVVTALPSALSDLHAIRLYGLAFGLYLAASLFASVVSGGAVDRWGPARPFIVGTVLFPLGSLLVGAAPTMGFFLAGRAVQGLGGGSVIVVLYVVVVRLYADALRPRAFAMMASAWVVPSIAGPPLTALVTQHLGWRWVFLGIPVLFLPAAGVLLPEVHSLREVPTDNGHEGTSWAPPRAGLMRVAAGAAAGGTLTQYAAQSRSLPTAAVCGAAAVVLLVLALPRLLPHGTLRARPGAPVFVLLRGLFAGAFFGTEVLLPLMVASRRGAGPALGGLILAAGSVGWAAGSWLPGRGRSDRSPRARLVGSCLLMAAGILIVMAGLSDPVPAAVAGLGWLVAGTGMGAGLSTVNRCALESSAPSQQGETSSSLQVSDSLASTVTTGVCAAIATTGPASGSTPTRFLAALSLTACLAALAALVAMIRIRTATR
ncbi:MFS transporter [Streptomyces gilvosporeus]|uniref:Major facilitator superfamily (MFS) profile domain-containing protein n=1 Tax=Streptomyces gilvosporeus TaxID=553510 RepID=A0A1V0TKU9_9ACTN|nr:MFS transporter [Streptomyces gilvosporeus]ARF53566.1 hypothetical protein B1H19_04680 [Streptomyces gilvosporeus]